jgi:hypothetical protein
VLKLKEINKQKNMSFKENRFIGFGDVFGDGDLDLSGFKAGVDKRKKAKEKPKKPQETAHDKLINARDKIVDAHSEVQNSVIALANAVNNLINRNELSESEAKGTRARYQSFMENIVQTLNINGQAIIEPSGSPKTGYTTNFDKKIWESLDVAGLEEHARVATQVTKALKEEADSYNNSVAMNNLDDQLEQVA